MSETSIRLEISNKTMCEPSCMYVSPLVKIIVTYFDLSLIEITITIFVLFFTKIMKTCYFNDSNSATAHFVIDLF